MATPKELSDRYLKISALRLEQAHEELEARKDYSQASEKAWGAVAEAVKAYGVRRGWNHYHHGLLRDISTQVSLEFGRPRLRELFAYADSIHNNFYEHRFDREEVQFYLERCRELLDIVDALSQARQRRFTPGTVEQENRLERLTRYDQREEIDAALDIDDLPPVQPEG